MGNSLVLQGKKMIKIMTTDGEILKYQSPLKVQQVLSEFPSHAISDEPSMARHLDPMTNMRCGALYYLLPQKAPAPKAELGTGVLRIKLVVSKQELKEILSKGGVSLDGMISSLQRETSKGDKKDEHRCTGWRPALESIPEGNDYY